MLLSAREGHRHWWDGLLGLQVAAHWLSIHIQAEIHSLWRQGQAGLCTPPADRCLYCITSLSLQSWNFSRCLKGCANAAWGLSQQWVQWLFSEDTPQL